MLKKDFIEKKIDLIQEELVHLTDFSAFTLEQVSQDFYKYNTLERLLEKIIVRAIDINEHLLVELAGVENKIPETYRETFLQLATLGVYPEEFALQISRSVGTRNILVHDYDDDKTDYAKIYASVSSCLKDYHSYCQYILTFLKKTIKKEKHQDT